MEYTLYNCRRVKDMYTNMAWNVGLTMFFAVVVGWFLYYRYRGKPTKEEEERRKYEAHMYIMKKLGNNIATREIEKAAQRSGILTGLPQYDRTLLPGQLQ
jgi:SNF family Na+-dependent transporter